MLPACILLALIIHLVHFHMISISSTSLLNHAKLKHCACFTIFAKPSRSASDDGADEKAPRTALGGQEINCLPNCVLDNPPIVPYTPIHARSEVRGLVNMQVGVHSISQLRKPTPLDWRNT